MPKIKKMAEYGVYQMDMGAQTFDDKLRKAMCLPDSAKDVEEAIKYARKLGLVVCADIMYNLPGQTMESWETTLQKAIELDAEVDCYSLHVDPGTNLEKMIKNGQSPPQGDAEYEKQMFMKAHEMLTKAGYTAVGRPLQPSVAHAETALTWHGRHLNHRQDASCYFEVQLLKPRGHQHHMETVKSGNCHSRFLNPRWMT